MDNMEHKDYKVHGAGLGLRRDSIKELLQTPTPQVGFMEVAPENWIGVGGAFGRQLREFTEKNDFVCHGLSLSIGSPAPLDKAFVKQVGEFLRQHLHLLPADHESDRLLSGTSAGRCVQICV
jgi:uncharacterized protein